MALGRPKGGKRLAPPAHFAHKGVQVKGSAGPARSLLRLALGLAVEASEHEPLAPRTSIRAGGRAELFVQPRSVDALAVLLQRANQEGIPVHVLGGGANTLVGDGGLPGLTLKLPANLVPEERQSLEDGGLLTLGAGAAIVRLVNAMRAQGWVGAEFLAGIPGTLGGALAMNAGTKHGECQQVLDAVELATANGVGWVARTELAIGYRHTALPPRVRWPSASAFRLRHGERRGLGARRWRRTSATGSAPSRLSQPNCGSVFQNPPGEYAGRLIEAVGLKGHTLGVGAHQRAPRQLDCQPRRRRRPATSRASSTLAQVHGSMRPAASRLSRRSNGWGSSREALQSGKSSPTSGWASSAED
jgi:UDP-N-acetylmuramate dehydrogenase